MNKTVAPQPFQDNQCILHLPYLPVSGTPEESEALYSRCPLLVREKIETVLDLSWRSTQDHQHLARSQRRLWHFPSDSFAIPDGPAAPSFLLGGSTTAGLSHLSRTQNHRSLILSQERKAVDLPSTDGARSKLRRRLRFGA